MGRPSKFKDPAKRQIIDAIKHGATYELAALAGGVSYDTFNNWMKAGEAGPGTGDYFEFFQAVKKAEGEAAVKWLRQIDSAANKGNWQAAAWKLERRYPQLYGRSVQSVEHSGEIALKGYIGISPDEWDKS